MGDEEIVLRSYDYFCDPFLQRNLYWLEENYNCKQDKDMNEDRSGETECPSFEFGIISKDRASLLFSF